MEAALIMRPHLSIHRRDPETDALYDTSHLAMAARFGRRTRELLWCGLDVRATARLAASYAFLADPSLRDQSTTFGQNLCALAGSLVRASTRWVH